MLAWPALITCLSGWDQMPLCIDLHSPSECPRLKRNWSVCIQLETQQRKRRMESKSDRPFPWSLKFTSWNRNRGLTMLTALILYTLWRVDKHHQHTRPGLDDFKTRLFFQPLFSKVGIWVLSTFQTLSLEKWINRSLDKHVIGRYQVLWYVPDIKWCLLATWRST